MYRNLALVSSIIIVFVVAWTNPFSDVLRRGYYREMIEAAKTVFYIMLLVLAYLFAIQQGGDISRIVLVGTGVGYYILACLFRNLWKLFLRRRYDRSESRRRLVLITTSERAEAMIKAFREMGSSDARLDGVALVDQAVEGHFSSEREPYGGKARSSANDESGKIGIVGTDAVSDDSNSNDGSVIAETVSEISGEKKDDCQLESIYGVQVVAKGNDIIPYLMRGWADEVFLDLNEPSPEYRSISESLVQMGIVTHRRIGEEGDYLGRDKAVQYIGGYPVVTVGMKIMTPRQTFSKRVVDIVCGIAGCIATVLLTIVIGPIIFIKSPGNIFFSQIRVGRNGKPFRMYKFRSMYPDAEERKQELAGENIHPDGMMFKVEQDPRIIGSKKKPGKGIGYFIRRTSIDEFPQFFNVLIGQMSLVGTRPPTMDEWENYELHHRSRMSVKPGITGMWQVSGRSEITDFDEVTRLDCEYIENWSMKLDMQILFRTVGAVSKGKGAK